MTIEEVRIGMKMRVVVDTRPRHSHYLVGSIGTVSMIAADEGGWVALDDIPGPPPSPVFFSLDDLELVEGAPL